MTRFPDRFAGLLKPAAYAHPVRSIDLVETHVSWVLLTGAFAYKIKRPVVHAFVDLREPERRAFFCREELRLNRRFAPGLYVGLSDVTASPGGEACMDGAGPVLEPAVKMRQFRRNEELDRLLETNRVSPDELEAFGRDLADIHAHLPVAAAGDGWATPAAIRDGMFENLDECIRAATHAGFSNDLESLRGPIRRALDRAEPAMALRLAGGRVRECHGDLHARNIVRVGSRLVAFDCMEFEPAFRWIDVAEEIAFLIADLEARRRPAHAHAFRTGYFDRSGDVESCRVLNAYRAHRALVRAKVAALTANDAEAGTERDELARQFATYVRVAGEALAPGRPILVLVSGVSGSGKTWLARRVAASIGGVHLRSDVERRRLAGLADGARSESAPGEGVYSRDMSERVYDRLAQGAADALAGDYPAVVDATFIRRADRETLHTVAERMSVRAFLVRCHAPRDVVAQRIRERARAGADESEATLSILRWQEARNEPIAPGEGMTVIDADTTQSTVADDVVRAIEHARSSRHS